MIPTRRTQPYRKGRVRPAGPSLYAMLAGKPKFTPNPMDIKRAIQKRGRGRRKRVLRRGVRVPMQTTRRV